MRSRQLFAGILISSILLSMGTGCSKKTKSKTKSNIAMLDQASGENAIYDQVASKKTKGKSNDEELKKAYSEFVVGMVNRCAANSGNENFMVSTDSILFAMEMTAAGADGETLDQMLGTLMPGVDKEDALLFAADRMDQIKSNQLKIANSVWINEKSEPAFFSNYLKYVENNFDAKIDALPFDASGVGQINSWVNDNTDGMIPSLIDKLESEDIMVLVNALSFDAKWKKPFEAKNVEDGYFYRADGGRDNCKYLCGENDVTYLHNDKATGLLKVYDGKKYAFMIMLPGKPQKGYGEIEFETLDDLLNGRSSNLDDEYDDGDDGITYDINSFIADMTVEDYWEFWESKNSDDVEYEFPEFTSEYSTSMKDILIDMGMEDAFDASRADFGNMSNLKPLFIGDVVHKTKIEVNALGTKAAASTGVIMEHNGVDVKRKVICNRPFAYAIVDLETGLPIFFGTVASIE